MFWVAQTQFIHGALKDKILILENVNVLVFARRVALRNYLLMLVI